MDHLNKIVLNNLILSCSTENPLYEEKIYVLINSLFHTEKSLSPCSFPHLVSPYLLLHLCPVSASSPFFTLFLSSILKYTALKRKRKEKSLITLQDTMLRWLQLLKEACLASADFSFPFSGDNGQLCVPGASQHECRY